MSKHWIKSNSVLVAVDLPDYQGSDRRGLSLIGLNDSFGFSVNIPRNTAGQIGSQKSSVDDPSFAPDISFDLSFIPTRTFSNENSLGFNFGFNSEYTSVFSGRNDTSFNVYLFISDKQSYDLIKQIRDQQSLNGIECLAIGSCYVNQYGLSIKVGDFARSSCSFIGSNLEASVVSSDKVKVPAINLENGTQGDYYLSLDWPQISAALDEITIAQMPLLPTTEVKFTAILNNLEIPSAVITPLSDAKSFGGDSSGKFVNGVLGALYGDEPEIQKRDNKEELEAAHQAAATLEMEAKIDTEEQKNNLDQEAPNN